MSAGDEKHSKHVPQILKNALSTASLEENKQLYKEWAADYDKDLSEHGYDAPEVAAFELNRALAGFCAGTDKKPEDFAILDVGSGTGMVAEKLRPMGYRTIDALDTSQDMLDVAKAKGVYRNLICADGNDVRTAWPKLLWKPGVWFFGSYDVVTSVGTFTPGHLDGAAVESVLKYIKKGGFFLVTVRMSYWTDPTSKLKATFQKLEQDGALELFALSPELPYHLKEPDVKFKCWTFRLLQG